MKSFWEKVDKTGECWLWTKAKDDAGYGQVKFKGKNTKAHRVAYYLTHGTFPKITRHTCNNPSCVRPEHLIDGTHLENHKDMVDQDRHNWSVTNLQAEEMRNMVYDATVLNRAVERYNISYQTARNILEGKTYKHIVPKGKKLPRQKSRRKLSKAEVEEIENALLQPYWGQQSILAQKYNVSRNTIQRIQYGTY